MVDGGMEGSHERARSNRLVGIEGLRAVAAVTILVYHVWLYAGPDAARAPLGSVDRVFAHFTAGVTLFFVLSGFLLFRPYVASAIRGSRSPRRRQYFVNRALRILPAYWVTLLAVAVVLEHDLLRKPAALLANATFLHYLIPGLLPDDLGGKNGLIAIVPSWSLAVEVVFYLAVPVLGGLAIRLARRRLSPTAAALVPVAFMVGLGLAAKLAAHGMSGDLRVIWDFAFPAHADWFAVGMTVAVLRVLWEDGRIRIPRGFTLMALMSGVALCVGAVGLLRKGVLTEVEYQTPIAVACGLLLATVVLPRGRGRLLRVLDSRPFVTVGLGSYSLFLLHDPILRGLREAGLTRPGVAGFVLNLVVIGGVTGAASLLTYRWVEKPALALKRAWQGADTPSDASVDVFGSISRGEIEGARPKLSITGRHAQDELEQLVAAVAGAHRDEVMLVMPHEPLPCLPGEALEVSWHLIQNALLYGSAPVVVRMTSGGGRIHVSVEDAGRGISTDFMPNLFQPHMRSHSSEQEAAGAGLGLFVARTLARHIGGDLSFTPAEPRGACFTLEIDITRVDAPAVSGSGDRSPSSRDATGRAMTFLLPATAGGMDRVAGG